ncbi:DUF2867 domain-containing protein [Bradyrhizobium sp. USDA 10063]
MKAREVTPDIDPGPLLAGAEFIDAYRIAVDGTALDARKAAEKMFARRQRWIEALLRLRNLIVAPLGLKTSGEGDKASHGMVGIFPVLSETPERLVAGFNDSHLDFRVVVDVTSRAGGQDVTTTTLVRTHNWLGRAYLAIILPFHRLVVAAMLRQVAL